MTMNIISILAVLVSPVIAILIGKWIQDRTEKRKDKMDIFKTLMMTRAYAWTNESMNAMNVIDIVFSDDKKVREAWKNLYYNLCISNPGDNELKKIQNSKNKLLEEMAISLGYKDKINWETIENPYFPKGLENKLLMNQQNQQMQMDLLAYIKRMVQGERVTDNQENSKNT